MEFTDDTQKNLEALKSKVGDTIRCPICQHTDFGVVNGRFLHPIQNQPNAFQIGGPAVESMMLVCGFCGYILEFALPTLFDKK